MNTTWVWACCALFASAGGLSLLVFGRRRLNRWVLIAGAAVPLVALVDLYLGPSQSPIPTPLSLVAGAGVSFLVALAGDPAAEPAVNRDRSDLLPWRQALDLTAEGVAVIDPNGRPIYRNPTWSRQIDSEDERTLLAGLGATIDAARSDGQAQTTVDRGLLRGLDAEAPHGRDTLSPVTATVLGGPTVCTVVVANMESNDLAVVTRQIAHNFNNLLSGIVGGAGMAMDQVAEDSEVYKSLMKIEDTAMQAAELTSELQSAARRVAPPGSHSTGNSSAAPL